MIYQSLCQEARVISSQSLHPPLSAHQWAATLEERRQQWLEMLGLWPLPERTPLQATVTGVPQNSATLSFDLAPIAIR